MDIILSFKNNFIKNNLNTSNDDLIKDFFIPVLSNSVKYDRGVGFFSSGWIRIASKGMSNFAENNGKARWVTSPLLDEDDWNAIRIGNEAKIDLILFSILEKCIYQLEQSLEKDTLSALSWMIADGILEFRFALPRNKLERGDFHDKFGIFTDTFGNQISFNGSYNDSIQGTKNYESLKIFFSWDEKLSEFVIADQARFDSLWNDLDPNVKVYKIPEAINRKIVRLREYERSFVNIKYTDFDSYKQKKVPSIPSEIALREYQLEAIDSWFNNNCQGLFEMATGTGKTITALATSIRLIEETKNLALVITCPYQHLVEQWRIEAENFGYQPILAFKTKKDWLDKFHNKIISFNHRDINNICVITTHTTFTSHQFQDCLSRIIGPCQFIADEVHHLGAINSRKYLPRNINFRLALSATPNRWFDEEGTKFILDYFNEIVYKFSIGDAIREGFLTKYYYYPEIVELTKDEMGHYVFLSKKIAPLLASGETPDNNEHLLYLLLQRSNLLNNAAKKIEKLSSLLDDHRIISHSLFYCAPRQLNIVTVLLGVEKKIKIHTFTAKEDNKTREKLLRYFSEGKIQGLVAIRCLDEGVDVPSTRTAYILASSSNPIGFIQRRGRILRKFPGKEFAEIYDFITIPPLDYIEGSNAEKNILRKEFSRFKEFAEYSNNFHSSHDRIWSTAKRFGIMDF